jgi:excisionase family DNA binding protein
MEGFMTTKEAAEKWKISVRQVQNHCKSGRIKGVLRVGTNYLIPENAMKPTYVYLYEGKSTAHD